MSKQIPKLDIGMGDVFATEGTIPASPYTQEIVIAAEQESNTSSNTDDKMPTLQEHKTSRGKENKKPKHHVNKASMGQVAKKTRAIVDEDGHTRSPHNVTIRDDYYFALQRLALEAGCVQKAWLYLDQAIRQYLEGLGLVTPDGRVKK